MTKNKIVNMIINISIGLLGVWIFIKPNIGVDFLRFYLGIILLIGSLSLFIYAKARKEKNTSLIAQAIILLVFGMFFIFSSQFSMVTLGLALAFWMIFEAFMNINLALIYRKFEISIWPIVLVFSIIAVVTAIYILANLSLSALLLVRITAIFIILRSVIIIVDSLLYRDLYQIEN